MPDKPAASLLPPSLELSFTVVDEQSIDGELAYIKPGKPRGYLAGLVIL